jgi:putative resolvase
LECLFDSFAVTLTMLSPEEDNTPEQELTADLLTVIASFSARLYVRRSHKQKELVKCAQAVITSP